jgi:hypothetical protein
VIAGCVYAGTDVGVFWSGDGGQAWATARGGAGTAPIDELEWRDQRTLLVVSHGRGAFEADSFDLATAVPAGTGCGILGPPVLAATPPAVGEIQEYDVTSAAASSPVVLMFGGGPAVPLPIGGCVFQVAAPLAFPLGNTDATGAFHLEVPIPTDPQIMDAVLTAQGLIAVAGGPFFGVAELSNAVTMTVGL